ncbi:MAG TPA: hypothetical protein VF403_24245, partial [Kofleriaceae bacterium]
VAAQPLVDDKKAPPPVTVTDPVPVPATGAGSTGTPSSGLTVSTGDGQLDRVQGINIDQIRDQRMGASAGGMPPNGGDPRGGANGAPPPNGANGAPPNGGPQPNGMAAMNGGNGAPNPNGQPLPGDKPAVSQDTPVYKKWWFWVVVAVGVYVVYEIATQNSSTSNATGRMFDKNSSGAAAAAPSGGYTLMRF